MPPISKYVIHAPHGALLHCKGWIQEAAYRMIQNNMDPDVAEKPDELIAYGKCKKELIHIIRIK